LPAQQRLVENTTSSSVATAHAFHDGIKAIRVACTHFAWLDALSLLGLVFSEYISAAESGKLLST
jgi:hypothetical protein